MLPGVILQIDRSHGDCEESTPSTTIAISVAFRNFRPFTLENLGAMVWRNKIGDEPNICSRFG